MSTATKVEKAHTDENTPVVVDLGKKKRKQIKDLCRGEGKLLDEVDKVVEELRTSGTIKAGVQPVIIVVKQRRSRRKGLLFR
jgi:hypothetical protein